MIKNLDSFQIVPDHFKKNIFSTKLISANPPPRRQKNFGQCTILGVKKIFPANIARLPLFEQQTAGFLAFLFHTLQTRTNFLSKKQTIFSQIVFL
jgi:hypothetical protein